MPLRRQQRHPDELSSLSLFAVLDDVGSSQPLQDAERVQAVLDRVRRGLTTSLAAESRLHGWRVQALFEVVVVELGRVRLLESMDEGNCYFERSEPTKLPDFRIVGADRELLVVEVKNVAPRRLTASVGQAELASLRRYADLTGARLVFAHYWSGINLWTLTDPSVFRRRGTRWELDSATAMKANELVHLGDAFVATTAPLTMTLRADPSQPRSAKPEGATQWTAGFTIGEVTVASAGQALDDPVEQRLALFMMHFGGWEMTQSPLIASDSRIDGVEFSFEPFPPPAGHERTFPPLVGTLSSMCSAAFNYATLTEDGRVARLRREPAPGLLADLLPEDYWEREHTLPMWRLNSHPSIGPRAVGPSSAGAGQSTGPRDTGSTHTAR